MTPNFLTHYSKHEGNQPPRHFESLFPHDIDSEIFQTTCGLKEPVICKAIDTIKPNIRNVPEN